MEISDWPASPAPSGPFGWERRGAPAEIAEMRGFYGEGLGLSLASKVSHSIRGVFFLVFFSASEGTHQRSHTAMVGETMCLLESLDPLQAGTGQMASLGVSCWLATDC